MNATHVWMGVAVAMWAVGATGSAPAETLAPFRPPAVPLVTVDPYTSVWSTTDQLTDSWPTHWTGKVQAMAGMIRVDNKAWRFMGPAAVCPEAATQVAMEVRPTQTIYVFQAGGVELTVAFMTPFLPDDLAMLSCPVSFVTFRVRAIDNAQHAVALYFDATGEWCVNEPSQVVDWQRMPANTAEGMSFLRMGTAEQPVLKKDGDDIRIDWGYLYVGAVAQPANTCAIAGHEAARGGFRDKGQLPAADDTRKPRAANEDWPVLAFALDCGKVGVEPAERQIVVAYDDIHSIEYMNKPLLAWWHQRYSDFNAMLASTIKAYPDLLKRCDALDKALVEDARRVGGDRYARLVALAYRHVWASGKAVVGPDGQPWFFHKECFSNGCVATVDVSYPASPFFALLSPTLLKGMMEPIFDFARSEAWGFPFSPHDVGRYPRANGQVYNPKSLEGQMPVEECGNMILMVAQVAQAEGHAEYAAKHWPVLTQWADYLKEKGLDPENQLCTDDFTGHLAHNTNLSLKAINAIGAFAMLCEMRGGDIAAAAEGYRKAAREMAAKWPEMAQDKDASGAVTHYRLAFDQAGTWSQKYNLVWDKQFKLDLFNPEIARTEVASYLKRQNAFGLPLDNRADFTKSDWLVWCATLAEKQQDFEALVAPLYRFCQESPSRAPFSDWYDTKTAQIVGFRARPVIGGVFIKLLADDTARQAWQARAAKP